MGRFTRNTAVLAKVETTPGTDAVPTGAADAVLVVTQNITPLDAKNVNRDVVRGYYGGSEQLVATASVKMSLGVELAGSGTAGTPPQLGDLLLGCATAEAILTTPNRVEYTPITAAYKTLTQYYYDDGALHKLLAAVGNCKLTAKVGERPMLDFEFVGVDGGITASANPATTLTAWKTPVTMTKANVVDITLGATYSAGVLTGGTTYSSTGLEMDFGNQVSFTALLGSESVDITQRETAGNTQLDLTAAQEVSFMTTVKANTTQSLAITIGTTAGNKIIIYGPAVQLIQPSKQELNGRRLIGFGLRFVPVNGNDEWRIVFL